MCAITCLCLLVCLIGSARDKHSKVIEAEKIILYDKTGIARITLEAGEKMPEMAFHNSEGQPLFVITAANHSSSLVFMDSKGNTRCSLFLDNNETWLKAFDSNGVNLKKW